LAEAEIDIVALSRTLARYREPSLRRSTLEIAVTALPLVGLWATMWASLEFVGVWLCLLLAIPAAGFLVRLFMIQHDCGHDAFFRRRAVNDWVGRIIGVFTLTPYQTWRRQHAAHHATSGNLDRRGIGDLATLTVEEYLGRSRRGRLAYRLSRNPFVLFGLGPIWVFLIEQRLPFGLMRAGWKPWVSTMATNLAIVIFVLAMVWLVGLGPFLTIHAPIVLLAGAVGIWLFFIQHQFEGTSWEEDNEWSQPHLALHGSSHYDLPAVLRWLTANIGVHHVHHLASRIPFYRLPEVLRNHPELREVGRVTLGRSLTSARLALWDGDQRRLVSFRECRRLVANRRRILIPDGRPIAAH
jgi:acyl-lipid omega-6 desaturase (Delta-12 desaturase)